ncbi:sigma-70 family RNA polymerase sigma factor [Arthrobacter sp. Y-9]|uniref:sigma-70 family RNA polymerase sigma factor n=1 Tax=Arthrobacter sp. Y-9 TaxID=3039385 RepID=UPI00241CE7B3|nr:sigma-70 family RNA polymerase sigma factor [Arthrobacter sp. Y-9]WFR84297.1 sigma-70 family RNA polymerase sigma factor [Arthrobacter sp. Y-9]
MSVLDDDANPPFPSDAELIQAVRAGDMVAYGELYSRHRQRALAIARRLTPDKNLAEDAVNEAFAAILIALRSGHGPTGLFWPYLYSSVSRAMHRMNRAAQRESPGLDDRGQEPHLPDSDHILALFEGPAARHAFRQLRTRFKEVIWLLDIEQLKPREAGKILGLSPNATVALHRRAKEALRLGYLAAHLSQPTNLPSACRKAIPSIPAFVHGTLSETKTHALVAHMARCPDCVARVDQLQLLWTPKSKTPHVVGEPKSARSGGLDSNDPDALLCGNTPCPPGYSAEPGLRPW